MESKHRIGIVDVVNIAGSVASLTGISLLWLKDRVPSAKLFAVIPVVAIVVALSLGLVSLAFVLIRYGYRKLVATRDAAIKLMCLCLSVAVALFLLSIAGYFISLFVYVFIRDALILRCRVPGLRFCDSMKYNQPHRNRGCTTGRPTPALSQCGESQNRRLGTADKTPNPPT